MLAVTVLFWLLLIWSLYDGDLDIIPSGIFILLWTLIFAGAYFLKIPTYWTIAPVAILDVILVFKVFGGDVPIY